MPETNGSCSPYYSSSYAAVAALSAAIAGLSLLLLIAVIVILILFKKLQFFDQRLILYLAVSSIFSKLALILHRVDYHNQTTEFYTRFCQFGGYFDEVSIWMLLMAVCSIVAYVSLRILFKKDTARFELVYLFFIFVFPLTFTWIPFVFNAYGRAGAWCWIISEDRETCEPYFAGQVLQFVLWFGPLYLLLVVLLLVYVVLFIHQYRKRYKLKREKSIQGTLQRQPSPTLVRPQDVKTLLVFPVLYFLLNIFPFINRTYNLVATGGPSLPLWYLAALANPLMGTLVTLAYFLDPETRKRMTLTNIRGAALDMIKKDNKITSYSVAIPDNGTIPRSDSYIPKDEKSQSIGKYDNSKKLSERGEKT